MKKGVLLLCVALIPGPAFASRWAVVKSEQDPFDAARTTFIAETMEGGHAIAVRCLDNEISFALSMAGGDAGATETFSVKIVADKKPPIETEGATLNANAFSSTIQFGDESAAVYLRGARKYWVRVIGGETTVTFAFTGGPSFDNALAKAERACGVEATAAPPARPSASPGASDADCSAETSCARQFACLVAHNELGSAPNADGFKVWCARQPGMKP